MYLGSSFNNWEGIVARYVSLTPKKRKNNSSIANTSNSKNPEIIDLDLLDKFKKLTFHLRRNMINWKAEHINDTDTL